MENLRETLLHNGVYLGLAFGILLILTIIATSIAQRLSSRILRSKTLAVSAESQSAFRRKLRSLAFLFLGLSTLALGGGTLAATWRQIRIGDYLRLTAAHMQREDWIALGLIAGKTIGILVAAVIAVRIIGAALQYLSERLHRAEPLTRHRERLTDLLMRLRLAVSWTVMLGALMLCGQFLGLSERTLRFVWVPAFIGVAVYVARFAVGAAHLAIDVMFDLSDALNRLESPLRYLGRFRHLSKLTRRTVDYFIYVGIATFALEQISPGIWATQVGRLAIRIIAIFYISRVLVEVCSLFMNEFFLSRHEQSDAEYQQRQTLVPVAAGLMRYGIYFAAIVMMLREAGIDPTPLLAGAGVVGVAIGLGAQAFVGDIVAGFFILFENLLLVGDFVEVGGVKGQVEEIGVRVTRIRDEAGVLHAIPNGEVRRVSSHSKGYVNVIIDIPLPYGENLHQVFDALNKKTAELREDQPSIMGLTEFSLEDMKETGLLLRTVTMVKPGTNQELSSILRLAFWETLTAAGVSAPIMRRLLITAPQQTTGATIGAAPRSAESGAVTMSSLSGAAAGAAKSPPRKSEAVPMSDIQRIKTFHLFRAFDFDNNGHIEKSDFEALARRIVEGQGLALGSPLHIELTTKLTRYWNELLRELDSNNDGRVSKEEFLQFSMKIAGNLSSPAGQSIQAVSDVLFTIADHDNTDTISEKEFVQWARAYGILDSVAAEGFDLIDSDSDGRISRDEWQHFTRDLFRSHKLNDASALVFGPGCREPVNEIAYITPLRGVVPPRKPRRGA